MATDAGSDWRPMEERLRATLFELPLTQLPNAAKIARWRRYSIYATGIELGFALSGLPLGAARKGSLGIFSTMLNLLLSAVSAFGLYSCAKLNPFGIAVHAAIVLGTTSVFMFMFLILAFTAEDGSFFNNAIILIIFVFCFVDVVVGCMTAYFTFCLHVCQKEVRRATGERLISSTSATATAVTVSTLETNNPQYAPQSTSIVKPRPTQQLLKQDSWGLSDDVAKEFPDSFKCPITGDVMKDPVICSDGHTYERYAIAKWLSGHSTSPKTNLILKGKALIPNHGLRAAIEDGITAIVQSKSENL